MVLKCILMRTIRIHKYSLMPLPLAGSFSRPTQRPTCTTTRAENRVSRCFWGAWSIGLLSLLAIVVPVTVSAEAARLVTIGGAVTETVFALGAGDQVVAVDTSSTYPQAAVSRPKVGYARTLAAEGILAMRPDHVLAAEHAGPEAVFEQLRAAGVAVTLVPDPRSVNDTVSMIETLATLLGRPDRAQALVRELLIALRGLPSIGGEPRDVIVVIGGQGGQIMVAGRGTAADAMLTLVGARNAASAFRGYRPVGDEALLRLAPQAVVVPDHALRTLGGLERLRGQPGFVSLAADQFVVLDSLLLLGMGPRLGEAAERLATALAPAPAMATP